MPAILVASDTFVGLAKTSAAAKGYPHLRILPVPHPFGNLTEDELERVAVARSHDVRRLLDFID